MKRYTEEIYRYKANSTLTSSNFDTGGDIPITPFDNALALRQMTEAFTNLAHSKPTEANANSQVEYRRIPKLLTLGGDHSIALPTLRALNKIHGPVAVVHFDACVHQFTEEDRASLESFVFPLSLGPSLTPYFYTRPTSTLGTLQSTHPHGLAMISTNTNRATSHTAPCFS